MRENCTSGLMSGEGKRHTLIRVTALLLDSTIPFQKIGRKPTALRRFRPVRASASISSRPSVLKTGPNNCSSRYLLAFIDAGFTSVATILAFSDLGELVAFFLAIVANHLDGFSKMAGMLGIDRRKRV